MPTLEALETAVSDYKRTQAMFDELVAEQEALNAQMNVVLGQLATAKASFAANEEALKNAAALFSKGGK